MRLKNLKHILNNIHRSVSSIYLGEHSNISAFQSSNDRLFKPIVDEYNHLVNLGFEHIIWCGCSTGATLILQGLHLKLFPSSSYQRYYLIDSLVKSRSPILTLMPFLRHLFMLNN